MPDESAIGEQAAPTGRRPWWWVPSLYFAQGVPYVVVMTVAVIMFKRLGVDNTKIALYTSWLYFPYAIKPLWSPLVQRFGTRRGWVIVMQLLVAAGLACAALAIPLDSFLRWSLVALAAVAICSATHDVAADGFYLLALTSHEQAWFVGIRSTAYRLAMIAGQGLLVMFAGVLESSTGLPVVEVAVIATNHPAPAASFAPNDFKQPTDGTLQRIMPAQASYEISFRGQTALDVAALKSAARHWNVERGFYSVPQNQADRAKQKAGWLVRLEDFLRSRFGPGNAQPAPTNERTGDVTVVFMRLAQPVTPGEQIVIQFGRAFGDSNFDVVEGERFALTNVNWDKPFASVVQVDAKLNSASSATFEIRSGNLRLAWTVTFFIVAALFLVFCIYHQVALPRPVTDTPATASDLSAHRGWKSLVLPFADFFRKPRVIAILAFLLLYRFPESQLVKLATPFLLDSRELGGLGLTTSEVGVIYGTIGVAMLTIGGLIGGFTVARVGLGRCLWPMALAIHLPNLAFLFMAYAQPESRLAICIAVAIEQFGYGFGFTAYMLYCVYVAKGKYQTVHYALCTGCMALGMMIPGMWSGWLQDLIGYQHFFVWIMLAMIPSLLAVVFVRVDGDFGKKTDSQD